MRRAVLIAVAACLVASLAVPSVGWAGRGLRFFHTADGNIDCGMVKGKKKTRKRPRLPGGARCDVKNHLWVAPARPRWCDLDWGFGAEVGDKRRGRYICAGDTVALPNSPVLASGAGITLGRYTCSVPGTAVRCVNNLTRHGFEVSAESVSLF